MIIFKGLDHIQLCIPFGQEEATREFWSNVIGLKEITKPTSLIANGGLWFEIGDIQLHIGVEEKSVSISKRHPAFEVAELDKVRSYLEEKGIKTQNEKPIPGVRRFSFYDPFQNRIELLEKDKGNSEADFVKQSVREQFSRSAESYVTSELHAKGKDLAKLVEIADVSRQTILLDVATGGGHVANAMAPNVNKVIALDLTKEILESAERFIRENGHKNVEFVEGDAGRMSFGNETFDIVTCRIAAHHFPQIKNFIREVRRVLRPGGQFLLVDNVVPEIEELDSFYNKVEQIRDYSHFRAWKKSEWLKMLEDEGLFTQEWFRFSKTFEYETWCNRMNLSVEKKEQLNTFMIQADLRTKRHFNIEIENKKVISFTGESVLLKAIKH
jgi:ubiquinone/menaquinone biosynthesis C-methylase UbiE/catechol 2,3-dioxygenase-like lactoylglutathione lyase family enzyme